MMCGNANGSDKISIWIIGRAINSRGVKVLTSFGYIWRANSQAWANMVIMREWLEWFKLRMKGKGGIAVLLLDTF